MEKMMQRLTMDKATQYTHRSIEKLRRRAEELVRAASHGNGLMEQQQCMWLCLPC